MQFHTSPKAVLVIHTPLAFAIIVTAETAAFLVRRHQYGPGSVLQLLKGGVCVRVCVFVCVFMRENNLMTFIYRQEACNPLVIFHFCDCPSCLVSVEKTS